MHESAKYFELNRNYWNAATPYHMASPFYSLDDFVLNPRSLNSIELELLGDVEGSDILHLQCHFGQDTLSLAAMGARVTGADFSEVAIKEARELSDRLGLQADFVCSDIHNLSDVLHKKFDIVFTSYGVLGWLPDMDQWAKTVSHFLKPGGRLLLVEFHPSLWMLDNEFSRIGYDYFNTAPIIEKWPGTYADRNAPIVHETVSWNHPLEDVLGSLLSHGLTINRFREFDYSPYECFPNMKADSPKQYRFTHLTYRIPMVYAVSAVKQAG